MARNRSIRKTPFIIVYHMVQPQVFAGLLGLSARSWRYARQEGIRSKARSETASTTALSHAVPRERVWGSKD